MAAEVDFLYRDLTELCPTNQGSLRAEKEQQSNDEKRI